MIKKVVVSILFLLISNLTLAENNSIKVIGPLGLTRSFQNNLNGTVNVVVRVKTNVTNAALKNIRTGKQASFTFHQNTRNNIFTFSNVESGVWSIIIGNVDDIVSVNIK